jgi:hypothetical protein
MACMYVCTCWHMHIVSECVASRATHSPLAPHCITNADNNHSSTADSTKLLLPACLCCCAVAASLSPCPHHWPPSVPHHPTPRWLGLLQIRSRSIPWRCVDPGPTNLGLGAAAPHRGAASRHLPLSGSRRRHPDPHTHTPH